MDAYFLLKKWVQRFWVQRFWVLSSKVEGHSILDLGAFSFWVLDFGFRI
jgi:hypothetical protein